MPKISIWILGDQLIVDHPALVAALEVAAKDDVQVVMIESLARIRQLPYQRKKLVLLISAMRHYAAKLQEEGISVSYIKSPSFMDGLREHIEAWKPDQLFMMAASEYHTRQLQLRLVEGDLNIPVTMLPNTQFLVEHFNPYPQPQKQKQYIMEYFYRKMRVHFDVLMDDQDGPEGGSWNYDKLNRERLPENLPIPKLRQFPVDEITKKVIEEINTVDHGFGTTDDFDLAVSHEDAKAAFDDFLENRLASFGPYEDAMSSHEAILFHSMLAQYLNIGLLEPLNLVHAVEKACYEGKAPINSAEGFIRQILGWREYIYWQYWRQMPGLRNANAWVSERPMPRMFWDGVTDMNCIHHVVNRLQQTGYTHHIERLMIICNFCFLAGINPKEVANWFLVFYIDAYDWVVLPNVIGMGLNADGGQTATKPYISSANYINRMSNYCKECMYKPKKRTGEGACPYNYLYWNFLIANEEKLRANPRMGPNVLSLRHIKEVERVEIQRQARDFLKSLPVYSDNMKP